MCVKADCSNQQSSSPCRGVIVSGALWMWMSALPHCLPSVMPFSHSAISSTIFDLLPAATPPKNNLPLLSTVVAQL